MEKPISIIIEETKQSLIDIINNSKLHPSILELIIKDIEHEVTQIKINTIMKEKKQYLQESTEE